MALKQNVIYIYFKGKHSVTSKSQYQYNHGQFLYFADLDLPQTFEVHFSNTDEGYAKPQIGSNRLVEIPDPYFWTKSSQIYAWIYLHEGNTDGETKYEVIINLERRSEPVYEEILPTQQTIIERAIAELNNAVDVTTENANKTGEDRTQVSNIKDEIVDLKEDIDANAELATEKAQEAVNASLRSEASAQNAAEYESNAHDYSDEAKDYAQQALESKIIASQKATIATDASVETLGYRDETLVAKNDVLNLKQDVIDYKNETKGYLDETKGVRADVQNIDNEVKDYASQAQASATSASQSATASANSATASANSASQSAHIKADVEELADDAHGYANSASQSASQASASEQGCARAVSDATSAAAIARARADEASGYAQTASTKASEAVGCVETATQKATESAQSASQALTYKTDAESAKTASQTAQGLAESARDSAITAKDDAESARDEAQNLVDGISGKVEQIDSNTERIESLEDDRYKPYVTDSASGAIASFLDGAEDIPLKSLIVDIEPVQDLHGQDAPYPAGGGKNKFDVDAWIALPRQTNWYSVVDDVVSVNANDGSVITNRTLQFKPNTQYTISFTNPSACRVFDESGNTILQTGSLTSGSFTTTESGLIAIKFYGSTYPTVIGKVQIEEGSTATAWSPYENLCPISGWTEVDVEQSGKNLLALPVIRFSEGTATVNDCFYLKQGTYTVSYSCADTHRLGIRMMDASGTIYTDYSDAPISGFAYNSSAKCYYAGVNIASGNKAYTMTIKHDCYVRIVSNLTGGGFTDAELEIGSTATEYEPYTGRSITIDLGQTVYGAHLDVLSGVLTVDRAMATFTGADAENWGLYVTYPNHFQIVVTPPNKKNDGVETNIISNAYTARMNFANNTLSVQQGIFSADGNRIRVKDLTCTTVAEFKAKLQSLSNGLQVCYKLATPIEIQLTHNQINSLLGVNNIWADSGDTEVEYRANTKLYIAKKIAEAISALS